MAGSSAPHLRIALLWGKPPKPDSIAAAIEARLRDAGVEVLRHLPHERADDAWVAAVRACHLIVHRGVRAELLERVHDVPASRWCNAPAAVRAVADRWSVHTALTAAGIAVPDARRATGWADVVARRAPPCVVKRLDGRAGRSAGVHLQLGGDLPAAAPFPGPYVVQELVPGDGLDRTCYVAGARVFVARKRVDPDSGRSTLTDVVAPSPAQRRLALDVGAALGLELYGLDAIDGPRGWTVVDVNPFPGARGVPGFADAVVRHVLQRARAHAWPPRGAATRSARGRAPGAR